MKTQLPPIDLSSQVVTVYHQSLQDCSVYPTMICSSHSRTVNSCVLIRAWKEAK